MPLCRQPATYLPGRGSRILEKLALTHLKALIQQRKK